MVSSSDPPCDDAIAKDGASPPLRRLDAHQELDPLPCAVAVAGVETEPPSAAPALGRYIQPGKHGIVGTVSPTTVSVPIGVTPAHVLGTVSCSTCTLSGFTRAVVPEPTTVTSL